ncbi:MAG UNVERIFIED_CONTAM: hypothetical protein LVQ98_05655 [Rickettsiaceae bacterium]
MQEGSARQGFVFINGIKVPIVGIVSMDLTILDVTGIDCNIGDTVEIIGPNNCLQTVSQVISIASSYEIPNISYNLADMT